MKQETARAAWNLGLNNTPRGMHAQTAANTTLIVGHGTVTTTNSSGPNILVAQVLPILFAFKCKHCFGDTVFIWKH